MAYLIELRSPGCPSTYVTAQAANGEHARALIDAELARDEEMEDVVIVAVHAIN